MIATKEGAEILRIVHCLVDSRLIEIKTEQIYSVGAADIEISIAIEVDEPRPVTRLPYVANLEFLDACISKLKRDSIASSELNIGDPRNDSVGCGEGPRALLLQIGDQLTKGAAPTGGYYLVHAIAIKPRALGVDIVWNQACEQLGHSGVPRQRGVFRSRELESSVALVETCCQYCSRGNSYQNLSIHPKALLCDVVFVLRKHDEVMTK